MGTMRVIDATGDTVIEWTNDDEASVAKAERVFRKLQSDRLLAFARTSGAPADTAERIFSFDAAADEILWVRPIAGG